jgi:N-acetylglucosamine-6-sulfatase
MRAGRVAGLMPSLPSAAVPAGSLSPRRTAVLLGLIAAAAGLGAPAVAQAAAKRPPNIVVITTDDQTLASFDERFMPATSAFFANGGTEFEHAITVSPSCCPSRAAYLSGQYPHNNGVFSNDPGYPALKNRHNILPAWLQRAGYRTAHFGKFLNHFGERERWSGPVKGWDRWYTLMTYRYFNYRLASDGKVKRYGSRPRDYITRRITSAATRFLRAKAGGRKPVYAQIDHFAPHAEQARTPGRCTEAAQPDPVDLGLYADEPLPQSELPPERQSFNEADVSDKSPALAGRVTLGPLVVDNITKRYRCQLASLAGVDRSFTEIRDALADAGALRRTVIVFTSDNGFFHGEHRLPNNKGLPYEEGIRVPLLAKLPASLSPAPPPSVSEGVGNIDLAPTLLEIAGGEPCIKRKGRKESCRRLDGRSLVPLLTGESTAWPADRSLLVEQGRIQYFCDAYAAIWSPASLLAEFPTKDPDTGECGLESEHYDMSSDPLQLSNLLNYPGGNPYEDEASALAAELDRLRRCSGIEGREKPLGSKPFCE